MTLAQEGIKPSSEHMNCIYKSNMKLAGSLDGQNNFRTPVPCQDQSKI